MWPNPQEITDLVTLTKKILNGKLHFLYRDPDCASFFQIQDTFYEFKIYL